MSALATDPFETGNIATYAEDLRAGRTTVQATTRAFLDRIDALNDRIGAYLHVDAEGAMATAAALDTLLASGTDLGPLMGVPVAIKDIVAVAGMPTTNGSLHDASDITGPEGEYVGRLRRAGCVILGKTRTVEYALGATGLNESRGTPWNPWDSEVHRFPGGSSSGSGAATAAGMAAFALGSDTGGSVRIPAALDGIFGHKTTIGLLPTDGVFPLCPTLDTLGPLCRSAADGAVVHAVTTGTEIPRHKDPASIRLGRPRQFFYDDLDPEVEETVNTAIEHLQAAGIEIVDIDLPADPVEREWMFPAICPPELVAAFGEARFAKVLEVLDASVRARAEPGLSVPGHIHAAALIRHRELRALAPGFFPDVDGWIAPTVPFLAKPLTDMFDPDLLPRALMASRNTQPANIWGLCATTQPVHQYGSALPVGLQVICPPHEDARALSIAMTIEEIIGAPTAPDLSGFLS